MDPPDITPALGTAPKVTRQVCIARLYRGQAVKLLRESHGYEVLFAPYERLLGIVTERQQKRRQELPNCQIAVCGGLAGKVLWLLSYQLDVIKSKVHSDGFGDCQVYRSMRHAFHQKWVDWRSSQFAQWIGTSFAECNACLFKKFCVASALAFVFAIFTSFQTLSYGNPLTYVYD